MLGINNVLINFCKKNLLYNSNLDYDNFAHYTTANFQLTAANELKKARFIQEIEGN